MAAESNGNKAWQSWTLGALLAVAFAAIGAVQADANRRMTTLEGQQLDTLNARQEIAVKVAVIQVQLEEIRASVSRIESFQKNADDKLGMLLSTTTKNVQTWQSMMKAYEQTIQGRR
jgi:predicted outer membrane lipoprotein